MLHAEEKIIRQRLATRNRINIASSEDADLLEKFISEWLESINQEKILRLDVSKELIDYTQSISQIMEKLNGKF
jgi:thymidylate kinase